METKVFVLIVQSNCVGNEFVDVSLYSSREKAKENWLAQINEFENDYNISESNRGNEMIVF